MKIAACFALVLAFAANLAADEKVSAPYSETNAKAISGWLDKNLPDLVKTYKHLHANPEVSLQERKTATLVGKALEAASFEVTQGVGKTGVVAVMKNGEGPTLLIRGDTDALPIIEQTGLPYASKVRIKAADGSTVGAMHACGHDVHTTMVIGVGKALADLSKSWKGTVVLIAQPAEELGKGARMMIADGLFERFPKPEYCLSLHVKSDMPTGAVGYAPGWAAANVDSVDITIFGKGGHGAKPHEAIDPVLIAAHVITSLQSLVSRRANPIEPAVVTVGSIHGGTKHNIIPGEVKLQLTVRSYSDEVRKLLLDGIAQITADTCKVFQSPKPPVVKVKDEFTPSCYNHPGLTAAAADLFRKLLGDDKVEQVPPTMGGEDFGRYARHLKVPGLQYSLGSISLEKYKASKKPGGASLPSVHSPFYAPDPEPTVRTAVSSMTNLAMALLGKP